MRVERDFRLVISMNSGQLHEEAYRHSRFDQKTAKNEIEALTGIRFFAAVAVVIFHNRFEIVSVFPDLNLASPIMAAGYLGVDLFFVLSGFILMYNYADEFRSVTRDKYLHFLSLRFARIYPVHVFTLGALVVFVWLAASRGVFPRSDGFTVSSFVQNLLLIHTWFGQPHSWNGPAWSISAEWFAYMVFPWVAMILSRLNSAKKATAGAIVAFAIMLLGFETVGFDSLPLWQISGEFLAGCFLARLYLLRRGLAWRWDEMAILTTFSVMGLLYLLPSIGADRRWVAPLFGLLILSLANSKGRCAAWLGHPRLLFWGEASYALYMTHEIVHMVQQKLLPIQSLANSPLPLRLMAAAGYGGILLGSAAATYLWIERPARRTLRNLISERVSA